MPTIAYYKGMRRLGTLGQVWTFSLAFLSGLFVQIYRLYSIG